MTHLITGARLVPDSAIEAALDQERRRIADDLHDDVAQMLVAAQLNLDAILEREQVGEEPEALIRRALDLVSRSQVTIREAIYGLSHPRAGTEGFVEQVFAVAAAVERDFGLSIEVVTQPGAAVDSLGLDSDTAESLLRAARETLVNAAKHARCNGAVVRLSSLARGRFVLSVTDDGIGCTVADTSRGHGISALCRNVRLHGGCFRIGMVPTGGTKVTISVPVERRGGAAPDEEATVSATISLDGLDRGVIDAANAQQ
jgi:signal transduction histidine kinase